MININIGLLSWFTLTGLNVFFCSGDNFKCQFLSEKAFFSFNERGRFLRWNYSHIYFFLETFAYAMSKSEMTLVCNNVSDLLWQKLHCFKVYMFMHVCNIWILFKIWVILKHYNDYPLTGFILCIYKSILIRYLNLFRALYVNYTESYLGGTVA